MGKSVKLTDGSYIDADYVYDATRGMTQAIINKRLRDIHAYDTVTELAFGGTDTDFFMYFVLPSAPNVSYTFRINLSGKGYKMRLDKIDNGTFSIVWTLT